MKGILPVTTSKDDIFTKFPASHLGNDWREASNILTGCYNEPHRKYHNMAHITRLLNLMEMYRVADEEMTNTILWHDIYYVPGSKMNEEMSANFAWNMLQSRSSELIENVINNILASKDHTAAENINLSLTGRLFLDFDLYDLSEQEAFTKNSALIYEEFKPFVASNEVYYKGRLAFFENLIKKPRIYWILVDREEKAREIITDEIVRLKQYINRYFGGTYDV